MGFFDSKENDYKNRNDIPKNALVIIVMILLPIMLIISTTSNNTVVSAYLVYAQNVTTTPASTNNNNVTTITNVTVDGNNYKIKYSITNAKLVSIVPQKEAAKLVVTIEPIKDGKLTINLPRELIDYKIAGSKDGNYMIGINGKQTSNFKEISNIPSSRTLEISFGGGDRTIEITGTQMAQASVSAIKAQTTAAVKAQMAAAAANKTKESFGSKTKNIGTNTSSASSHIKSNTSGASNSFVNKTIGALSNVTGGIKKLLTGK
jgi:hypothetical protein